MRNKTNKGGGSRGAGLMRYGDRPCLRQFRVPDGELWIPNPESLKQATTVSKKSSAMRACLGKGYQKRALGLPWSVLTVSEDLSVAASGANLLCLKRFRAACCQEGGGHLKRLLSWLKNAS